MKHKLQILIFLAAVLLQVVGFTAKAQDVTFDLTQGPSPQSDKGVSVAYKWYAEGAHIYTSGGIDNRLTISSSQSIACIKFEGEAQKTGNIIVSEGGGTLKFKLSSTSVWEGDAIRIVFAGEDAKAEFYVKKLLIWFKGSPYDPNTDASDDEEDKLIGTPLVRASAVPVDGEAVKMAIVSTRQFGDLVKEYGDWKTQQGYQVEEIYAEDYNNNGALTGEEWAMNIQAHLKETRPAFVLIMGDDYHVPVFNGKEMTDKQYPTDYYYGVYNDGTFPDAYVGRFSGHDADDIKAQMDKTKYMSQLPAHQGGWLTNCLAINNSAGDIASMTASHEYLVDYLEGFGESVVTTEAGATSTINNTINNGCAVASYFGHGMINSFNGSYTNNDAAKLANDGKYPIFLAMTCLTGTFDIGKDKDGMCLAEKMQRMPHAGTVAYVGATHDSYAPQNILFIKGTTTNGQTYLGFMGSMFPTTKSNRLNQHARTIGEAVAIGVYSTTSTSEHWRKAVAEYTELFGDPTYQPYCTKPLTMSVGAPTSAVAGHIINVKAAPKAVVCVSAGRYIAAVGLTDDEGNVALKLAKASSAGTYTLYCSAPNYTDWQRTITLAAYDGQDDVVDGAEDGGPSTFNFEDFTRKKVLIEKFTGQNCQYCYGDDTRLNEYLDAKNLHDIVVEMRHYSYPGDGVGGKYLRIPDVHGSLSSTFAVGDYPNYLVDRGGGQTSSNWAGYHMRATSIVGCDYIRTRFKQDCKVSLSLDGSTYNPETRQLKVIVSGKTLGTLPDLHLNIFLTQDGLKTSQLNAPSDFVHNGVSRDVITGVNGDALELNDDNTFQKEYIYTLKDSYGNFASDINNMKVVAFVSSFDTYGYGAALNKDCTDSEVYNTDDVCIGTLPLKAQAPVLPGSDSPIVPPAEPKEITFADGTAYNAATAVHYDKVTYTRDFTNTNWQALYVPFSIDCEKLEDEYEIARIYNFIDYDDNNDGKFDRTYLVVQKKTTGSTVANTPYLIRAKNTGKHTLVMTDKVLERAETGSVDCGSMDYDYTFYGTYTTVSDMFANGYYALSNGALNKAEDSGVKLKPQRWYMQITTRNGGYPSATHAKNIRILVDGEDETEGIKTPSISPKGENPVAYDLMGRGVKGSVKGISIVNGKKIIR